MLSPDETHIESAGAGARVTAAIRLGQRFQDVLAHPVHEELQVLLLRIDVSFLDDSGPANRTPGLLGQDPQAGHLPLSKVCQGASLAVEGDLLSVKDQQRLRNL